MTATVITFKSRNGVKLVRYQHYSRNGLESESSSTEPIRLGLLALKSMLCVSPSTICSTNYICLSYVCSWLIPIFKLGNSKDLEISDLPKAPQRDSAEYVSDKLEK